MRKLPLLVAAIAISTVVVWSADWPMTAGGPQRAAWARSERLIDKNNVSQLQVLYKYQPDNPVTGPYSLTPPIVNGNLITYVGFKEMLILGANSGRVFSVDADVNKIIWTSKLAGQSAAATPTSEVCPGGMTAPVVFSGSSSASRRFAAQPPAPGAPPTPRRSSYLPPLTQTLNPLLPTTLNRLSALYTVSGDGSLHILNSSTGEDLLPPVRFLPAHSKVTSLNVQDNVVYATTGDHCDGFRNTLFALDLLSADKHVSSFALAEGSFAGAGGTTLGNDGAVYVHAFYSPDDDKGHTYEAVISLAPKTLAVKDFALLGKKKADKSAFASPGITPLVFSYKGRDVVLAGGRDGRLYLLDSKSLGGTDHRTPLFASEPIARTDKKFAGNGFRGTFTGWVDFASGSRWFYAPLYGPADSKLKLPGGTDNRADGSLVALRLTDQDGKPALQTAWLSKDLPGPASPVSANGMVFLLATGESGRLAKPNGRSYSSAEWKKLSTNAKLVALDAVSGAELYSSGTAAKASSHNGGLAVANGRAYFSTDDNSVYCFGLLKGQTQLSEEH